MREMTLKPTIVFIYSEMQVSYSSPTQEKAYESQRLGNAHIFSGKKKKNYIVGVGYDIKVSTWKGY